MEASAQSMIEALGLAPHPEGGWYRETVRAGAAGGGRAACTAILFLLEAGQRSHWHRIDATEIWLHQAGGPLTLRTVRNAAIVEHRLGPDPFSGHVLQAAVAPGDWQAAQAAQAGAAWSLAACVVAPAFEFAGFELAPPGWEPAEGGPR